MTGLSFLDQQKFVKDVLYVTSYIISSFRLLDPELGGRQARKLGPKLQMLPTWRMIDKTGAFQTRTDGTEAKSHEQSKGAWAWAVRADWKLSYTMCFSRFLGECDFKSFICENFVNIDQLTGYNWFKPVFTGFFQSAKVCEIGLSYLYIELYNKCSLLSR